MWLSEQTPAMFAQNCKCILLALVVTTPQRYITASLAKLKWSAFLEGGSVTLWFDDGDIGACGVHQLHVMDQELFPQPVWHLLDLVVWLWPCVGNLWSCISSKRYLGDIWPPPSLPTLPSSHPLPRYAGPKWRNTSKQSSEKAKNPAKILFKG